MHLCPSPSPLPSAGPDPNGYSCALGPCTLDEKCCGQMYCVPRNSDCCWDSLGAGYCQSPTLPQVRLGRKGVVVCTQHMHAHAQQPVVPE